MRSLRFWCREVFVYWRSLIFVFAPFLLSPLIIIYSGVEYERSDGTIQLWRAMNCAYTVALMAVYWVTEAIPIPITALVPLVAFPLLGVETLSGTASPYLSASNFLFVGGLIVALAVEEVNLHRRLALKSLLIVGEDPRLILLAFMLITWFLSMWMSNTATTAMMLPIALAVINELVKNRRRTIQSPAQSHCEMPTLKVVTVAQTQIDANGDSNTITHGNRVAPEPSSLISKMAQDPDPKIDDGPPDRSTWTESETKMAKAVLLSLCYSANIGGTATLTGTVPNVVALKNVRQCGLNYASWMADNLPIALLFLLVAYIWIVLFYFPNKDLLQRLLRRKKTNGSKANLKAIFQAQYDQLGSFSFGEIVVGGLYIILVILWIFRDPKFTEGWGSLFPKDPKGKSYVGDAIPAIAISILLFALPIELPHFYCFRKGGVARDRGPQLRRAILTWQAMSRFPWDVILLLGGGFAMAHGVLASGLSDYLAEKLELDWISPAGFCALITTFVTFFTEVTSNTSTANIFLPILVIIAKKMSVHPYYFVVPVTVACSFAFMLPVATPPNAIVFGAGILRIKDMAVAGFILNCIGVCVALFNANILMPAVFGISIFYNQTIQSVCNGTAA